MQKFRCLLFVLKRSYIFLSHNLHDCTFKDYFDKILSKYQCGFRKGFSTQHCLLAMIEKLRKSLDSRGASAALLTDLFIVFDCLQSYMLTVSKKGL